MTERQQQAGILLQATLQLETIAFDLLDADLVGAADEIARCGQAIQRMREELTAFVRIPAEAIR